MTNQTELNLEEKQRVLTQLMKQRETLRRAARRGSLNRADRAKLAITSGLLKERGIR